MTDEETAFRLKRLTDQVNALEHALARESEWTTKLVKAIRTGNVCEHLGHYYERPTRMIRDRIIDFDWHVEKNCQTCGESAGVWAAEDLESPKALARRRARTTVMV